MKTLTIICDGSVSGRNGKSLLAERLASGITGDALIGSHIKHNLTREKIQQLYKSAHPRITNVVIFEMVPHYEIEQLIQDLDFYKLLEKTHVIMTSPQSFSYSDIVPPAAPHARFVIQILTSELIFPQ